MGKMIISRVGEKRIMNCGLEAEIIAYRNALDMDVRMSDGRIVKGCQYNAFKHGAISGLGARSNNFMTLKNNQVKRIGEERMMNCGLEAEIIAYRNAGNMDVRLSDGRIVEHCRYDYFLSGSIGKVYAQKRLGEKRIMNCGLEAEIIAYRNAGDMDVRMSDGRIVRGCSYNAFKRSAINGLGVRTVSIRTSKKRIGEKRIMNNGLEAEVIAYRGYEDIDIRFTDGTIREHCRIDNFLSGSIGKVYAEERLGEKRIMNCGLEAEIIAYRGARDIDVRMSDGRIVKGCQYNTFKHGEISGLGAGSNRVMTLNNNQAKRIGEKRMMNCGLEAEIIAYRACSDVDVRLSDGSIYEHKQYWAFSNGKIGPHHRSAAKNRKSRR